MWAIVACEYFRARARCADFEPDGITPAALVGRDSEIRDEATAEQIAELLAQTSKVEPTERATLRHESGVGHKNIDLTMVADLMAIVLGDEQDAWIDRLLNPPPLVSTQGDKNILAQLPDAFVAAARAWSEADCNDVGRKWSEAVTASGNDWPVYSSAQVVLGLAELAAQAEAGEHIYYWA